MTKPITVILAVSLALAGGSVYADKKWRASLDGAQEVPPVVTDTKGKFRIRFKPNKDYGKFELRINDGEQVTQAHLHCGPAGANGPVAAFLAGFHELGWDVDGKWVRARLTENNIDSNSCVSDLDDLIREMDAGNIYVNVHTVKTPSGEVRGQVSRQSGKNKP